MDKLPSAEEMAVYRATAVQRERQRQQKLLARRERAWAVAQQAAQLLKRNFGATAVILFGSLLPGKTFHERSDIDLAVDGITPENYFRAWNAADNLDDTLEINLVHLDDATPALRKVLDQEGHRL